MFRVLFSITVVLHVFANHTHSRANKSRAISNKHHLLQITTTDWSVVIYLVILIALLFLPV